MLVLSRFTGERIVIGGGITITVVESHDGKVRLGIEAPQDVPIYREELIAGPKRVPSAADIIRRLLPRS